MPVQREVLVEQLRYLLGEVEALGPLLAGLPPDALTMHLPGERSILDALAYLAALDRRAAALLACDRPGAILPEPDEAEPDASPFAGLAEVLAETRAARRGLLRAFEEAPDDAWRDTDGLADAALAVAQRDVAELSRLAHRLHESDLRDAKREG